MWILCNAIARPAKRIFVYYFAGQKLYNDMTQKL